MCPKIYQSIPRKTMENKIKCVVVGDGAVGKTSILMAYTYNNFPFDYIPTIYETHCIEVFSNGKFHSLQLYDTAGQEDYDRLRPLGYQGTHVFVVCFAIDNRVSMFNVKQKWIPEIMHHCPRTPYIVVGTKIDLRKQFKMGINREEGTCFAKAMKASKYVECSARTQEGLHQVFEEAVATAIQKKCIKRVKCKML